MAINQGNQSVIPLTSNDGGYNMHAELVRSIVSRVNTAMLVVVKKVKASTKTIDVLPLVTQVDASGKPISHGIIYNVPYLPMQYGNHAIVMTPAVNDIGLCVFCHSDISTVKSTKKESLPGSYRKHSMADAIYIGGILNNNPTNYIEFTGNDINIVAANIEITGSLTNNGVNVGSTHTHSGVQTGGGNTGAPN